MKEAIDGDNMKITIIHGQSHKGSTYHIAHMLAEKINGEMTDALDEADVIILASPVYVYHATGAMKAFLDHYGYRWMVHCPEESM